MDDERKRCEKVALHGPSQWHQTQRKFVTSTDTLASVLRAKRVRRANKTKQKQNKIYERGTQELDKWVRGGARVFLHGF